MKRRRKAIDCVLIRESNTNKGYFRYDVTIEEKDGSRHVVPTYGEDMQDAISRLIWNERLDKVGNSNTYIIMLLGFWLSTIIIPTIMTVIYDNPVWIICALFFSTSLGFIMVWLDKYFNKK